MFFKKNKFKILKTRNQKKKKKSEFVHFGIFLAQRILMLFHIVW